MLPTAVPAGMPVPLGWNMSAEAAALAVAVSDLNSTRGPNVTSCAAAEACCHREAAAAAAQSAAAEVALATAAAAAAAGLPVPYSGGSCFSGEFSFLGEHCPDGPDNRGVLSNVCPGGLSCFTSNESVTCPAGRFCPPSTWNNGTECPSFLDAGSWHAPLAWGLATYCPEASDKPHVCPEGHFCPDPSAAILCPPGRWCPVGVNASIECTPDVFGTISAEEQCPEGVSYAPAQREHIYWLLMLILPLVGLCELGSIMERKRRRRRHGTGLVKAAEAARQMPVSAHMAHAQLPDDMDGTSWMIAWLAQVRGKGGFSPSSRSYLRSARAGTPNARDAASPRLTSHHPVLASPLHRRWEWMSQPSPKRIDPLAAARKASPSSPLEAVPLSSTPLALTPISSTQSDTRTIEGLDLSFADTTSRSHSPNVFGTLTDQVAVFDVDGVQIVGKGFTFTHVELRNLDFHIGRGHVLRSLSANMHHGELVGLMGESGSGKTTLLNVLGGRATYGKQTGDLFINGANFDPHSMRHLLGYVPQAHILFKELTVYENLAYAAELRLRRPAPKVARDQLVEMALDLLGLQECRHFVCDPSIGERLSGGQMRRIGIGMELVCDPPIMLLDEPTSALDAVNTRLVVSALKDLAKRGVLVIASLHQPRHAVYDMLDRLLLLRKGELMYGGRQADALGYFRNLGFHLPRQANPADFFIEVSFGFEASDALLANLMSLDGHGNARMGSSHGKGEDEADPRVTQAARQAYGRLRKRFPETSQRRLLDALALADGHSGRAFALLVTPCASLADAKARWDRASRKDASPRQVLAAARCQRTFAQIAELSSCPPRRIEWWSNEMLRDAATQPHERFVTSMDLGHLWRQWFISSISHADKIMSILADRQSEDRFRIHAILRFAKDLSRRFHWQFVAKQWRSQEANSKHSTLGSTCDLSRSAPAGCRAMSDVEQAAAGATASSRLAADGRSSVPAPAAPLYDVSQADSAARGSRAMHASRLFSVSSVASSAMNTQPHVNIGVSLEDFKGWFEHEYGEFLLPELAVSVWLAAAEKVRHRRDGFLGLRHHKSDDGLCPTWTQLRHEIYTWQLPEGSTAGWLVTFYVCTRRYIKKLLRKRRLAYLLLLATSFLGVLSGILYGENPGNNDIMIFLLLFNALFGSLAATSTIHSLGADEVALFQHEAASGVVQTAEVFARVLIDLLWPLWLLPAFFTLALKGVCTLPLPFVELWLDWALLTYALSPFGYICTLLVPSNAVVFTSSIALVSCAFGSGFFGLKLKNLPEDMQGIFPWLSPGCPTIYLISVGSTVRRPHSTARATVIKHLLGSGLLTAPDDGAPFDDQQFETSEEWWQRDSVLQLLLFGTVMRIVTLFLFTWRSNATWSRTKAALRERYCRRHLPSVASVRAPPAVHLARDHVEALSLYEASRTSAARVETIKQTMSMRQSLLSTSASAAPPPPPPVRVGSSSDGEGEDLNAPDENRPGHLPERRWSAAAAKRRVLMMARMERARAANRRKAGRHSTAS